VGDHRHDGQRVDEQVLRAGIRRVEALMRSHPELVAWTKGWGLSPIKEMTESLAVWGAVLRWARYRGHSLSDRSIVVAVVGDGRHPRTGALVAASSAWSVVSIDPNARGGKVKTPGAERLRVVKAKAEDVEPVGADYVLAVHSHASVEGTRRHAKNGGVVVALPCCVAWPITDACEHWLDPACLSPDRRVVVERVVRQEGVTP
jgi:hypothetical protein